MVTTDSRPAADVRAAGDAFPEFPGAAPTAKRTKEEILADVKSMKPPEFIHHYPCRVNPHKFKGVANSIAWFHEQSLNTLLSDPEKMQLFLRSNIHDLVPLIYVDAEEEDLSWLCSYVLWTFIMDDFMDEPEYVLSPEKAAPIIVELNLVMMWSFPDNPVFYNSFVELITIVFPAEQRQAIFDTVDAKLAEARLRPGSVYDPVYDTSDLPPLISGFSDLWVRLLASAPLDCAIRWVNAVQAYLLANVTEAKNRNIGHVPSMAEYIPLRRKSVGLDPLLVLAEFAYKLSTSLPAKVFDTAEMTEYFETKNDIIGWHNDIYSLKKEVLGNEFLNHNMVYIISHTRGCSLSDAQAIALDMLHTRVQDFGRAVVNLEKISTPDSQEAVSAYIKIAQFWISGCHEFDIHTERYGWV